MERLRGHRFKRALMAGIEWFSHFRHQVDQINVFPVADGDTGKNMFHAFQAALQEIRSVRARSAAEVAWAAAQGALLGGRGCSGMILSGFFAGFAEAVGNRHTLTPKDLARAFQIGSLRARERVEHPREGTILSVGEAAAQRAAAAAQRATGRGGIFLVIHAAWEAAREALAKTSRQLKVLSEHHVVDAGGQGLVYFFEGLVRYSRRQSLTAPDHAARDLARPAAKARAGVGRFHFCTEFLLADSRLTPAAVRRRLARLGEHLMVAAAPGSGLKVHVHTDDPEAVFGRLADAGRITWRKVDDMAQQHRDTFGLGKPRR